MQCWLVRYLLLPEIYPYYYPRFIFIKFYTPPPPFSIPLNNFFLIFLATTAQLGWQVATTNIYDGEDCWRKFRSNQWLGALIFSGIVASNLIKETPKDRLNEEKELDTLD